MATHTHTPMHTNAPGQALALPSNDLTFAYGLPNTLKAHPCQFSCVKEPYLYRALLQKRPGYLSKILNGKNI